jgi:sensor histidine kinase YesM
MRLAVLQAQVEPHFLFNTMASVRSLVRSDPQRAEATISALVDHLRATLPKLRNTEAGATTLGEQLDICRSYLEVMRVRTGERLNYSIQVPRETEALPFPPLMLISLVENAVKHGAEPKPGPCTIEIAAQQVDTDGGRSLQVSVSDDGVGLQEGAGNGVGLANIRDLLATRFGERASFELTGRESGGVVASICVPVEAPVED